MKGDRNPGKIPRGTSPFFHEPTDLHSLIRCWRTHPFLALSLDNSPGKCSATLLNNQKCLITSQVDPSNLAKPRSEGFCFFLSR
jgi:hypothetical protein